MKIALYLAALLLVAHVANAWSVNEVWSSIKDTASKVGNYVGDKASSTYNTVKDKVANSDAYKGMKKLGEKAKDFGQKAWNKVFAKPANSANTTGAAASEAKKAADAVQKAFSL